MDVDSPTLRALLWRSAAGQAKPHGGFRVAKKALRAKPLPVFRRLTMGVAIACAPRLAAKRHRSAEPVIIMLKDH
jgi:hypothetical protein